MDRLFLDANVLFSAAYGSRGLVKLWEKARNGRCKLMASAYVVEEAVRNLSRPEQLTRLKDFLTELDIVPECDPGVPCPVDLPDKDRPVLMAAMQARATHLITGDLERFGSYRRKVIRGVCICTPRDYSPVRRVPGSAKGKITVMPGFEDPLPEAVIKDFEG
jgi:predicted nucleic acid-binding protein